MKYLAVLIYLLITFSSCIYFWGDECGSGLETVWISNQGDEIDNPIEITIDSTYQYDIMNFAYLMDRDGGRDGCPLSNKRPPDIDKIEKSKEGIAIIDIVNNSTLQISGIKADTITLSIFLSGRNIGEDWETRRETLETTVIVN